MRGRAVEDAGAWHKSGVNGSLVSDIGKDRRFCETIPSAGFDGSRIARLFVDRTPVRPPPN
jgi:hypothetical protein